jgi:hypothetical protein
MSSSERCYLEFVHNNKSIEELSRERRIVPSTVISYIAKNYRPSDFPFFVRKLRISKQEIVKAYKMMRYTQHMRRCTRDLVANDCTPAIHECFTRCTTSNECYLLTSLLSKLYRDVQAQAQTLEGRREER